MATAIRAALNNDSVVPAYYTVGGTSDKVILTALTATTDDASLNIAIDNDTSTGLTPAPTSVDTQAGAGGASTQIPVVTIEAVKVAADRASKGSAQDVFVACATRGDLNQNVMKDTLGRPLSATEIAVLKGPNSNFSLRLS